MKINIRLIYLYLFSFVGLVIFVIGCTRLVDLGLKVYVFKNADMYGIYPQSKTPMGPDDKRTPEQIQKEAYDQERFQIEESKRNRQRETSSALAMIFVGGPLYLYHWGAIQNENKTPRKKK